RRFRILPIQCPVDGALVGAVSADALLEIRLAPDEIAHHAGNDAAEVVRLDQRVDVVVLASDAEALLGHASCFVLIAPDEVKRTEAPEGTEQFRRVADPSTELSGARERLRALRRRPSFHRNQ